nr:circadian locomoter output cycles protein kaput-like isoform X4 [Dermacentor andersoni]
MCHDLCLYHPHQSFSDQLSAWSNKGSLRLKPMFLLGELPTFVKILRPLLSDEPLANVEASVVGPLLIILSFCEPFILFGLLFQSLEGFLLVLSLSGQILYTSESVASLLGYLPHELHNIFILDILHESNHGAMCEVLSSASSQGAGIMRQDGPQETYVSVDLYMKRGNLGSTDSSVIYEPMNLKGTFLTAVGEAGALPGGHGAPADAAAHARAHPLRRLEERVQLSTQPRVEVPLLGPQSPSHNRLPAVRGSRNFRIRLLPRGGPRESCGGSRGLDADRRRHVLPLPLPDQGPAVDLVADALLHHLPPVELQAGIRRMHQHRHELRRGLDAQQGGAHQRCIGVVLADVGAESHVLPELAGLLRAFGQLQGQPVSQPVREVRMRRRSGAGSCGNQLSLPFTEACTITRESPATGGRLVSLASSEPSSSRLQHEPMDQRPPYQTTTACRAPLITLTALQPIAATFAGSGHCGTAAAAAAVQVLQPGSFSACLENDSHISTRPVHSQPQGQVSPQSQQQQSAGGQQHQQQQPQQDHFQDYLRRRHQALQQQILRQQEELRRVSEQLMLVHFINPNLTATVTSANAPLFTLSLPTTTLSVPTSTIAGPTGALTPAPYLLATAPAGCTDNSSRRDSMHHTQSQQLQHQQQTLQEQQQQQQQDRQSSGFLGTVPQGYVAPVYPLQLPTDQMIFTSNFNAASNIYMDASGTGSGEH